MPPSKIRRRERRAPVAVVDAQLLGIVVQIVVDCHDSLAAAAKWLSVDRRTLRRLRDGRAGTTITRSVYDALVAEARWIDEESDRHDLEDYGALNDWLEQAVLTDRAAALIRLYRTWLAGEVAQFGHGIEGSLAERARLMGPNYRMTVEEVSKRVKRELAFRSALGGIQHHTGLCGELRAFERRARKAGWTPGMARYELALRRVIDPLTSPDRPAIERGWEEMIKDDDQGLARYLKAAFQKELALLSRASDLERAAEMR